MNELYEKILNSKKVRYEFLNSFIPSVLPPPVEMTAKHRNNINVFVNISSLYNSLYNPDLMSLFSTLNRRESYMLAADIANMCGHYRHYFASTQNCYTTFFLYYSDQPATTATDIYPAYKKEYYYKRHTDDNFKKLNRMFQVNMKILQEFIYYLPHIYLVNTKMYDPMIFPEVFMTRISKQTGFNLLITYETPELQYATRNGFILLPKGSKSYLIDGINNFLVEELSTAKILKKDMANYDLIAREYISEIITFSGHSKYEIPSINGLTMLKMLRLLYDHIYVKTRKDLVLSIASESKFEDICKLFLKIGKMSEVDIALAERNRNLLDISYISQNAPSAFIQSCKNMLRDTVDLAALKRLNNEYYNEYPLHLDFLLEGEQY